MENIKISHYGNLLEYQDNYSPEQIKNLIERYNLNGLRIFSHLSDEMLEDINFLADCPFLETLGISTRQDYNLDFLKNLKNLKGLNISVSLDNPKQLIDLSEQKRLESFSIQWRKNIKSLENCQRLKEICLIEFKEKDFLIIASLTSLQKISIKTGSIKSLDGLENMHSLRLLEIGNCRYLTSIATINGLVSLRKLVIEACSKIGDYNSLINLPNLESLTLRNCNSINSIKFIDNFPNLKELNIVGNTNIFDGDIKPALRINKVIVSHKKHYNVKFEMSVETKERIKRGIEKAKQTEENRRNGITT
jgi:hypothetical protein